MEIIKHVALSIAFAGSLSMQAFAGLSPNADFDTSAQKLAERLLTMPQILAPMKEPELNLILAMGSSNTSRIVGEINRGARECESLPLEYHTDCLAQTLNKAGNKANSMTDYVSAGKELKSASRKLSSLVAKNVDKGAKKIKKRGKTFQAVKKSAVAIVHKKAVAIVVETQTRLIRSAGNSKKRQTHFGRIATAVGSTKRLLRSA